MKYFSCPEDSRYSFNRWRSFETFEEALDFAKKYAQDYLSYVVLEGVSREGAFVVATITATTIKQVSVEHSFQPTKRT